MRMEASHEGAKGRRGGGVWGKDEEGEGGMGRVRGRELREEEGRRQARGRERGKEGGGWEWPTWYQRQGQSVPTSRGHVLSYARFWVKTE